MISTNLRLHRCRTNYWTYGLIKVKEFSPQVGLEPTPLKNWNFLVQCSTNWATEASNPMRQNINTRLIYEFFIIFAKQGLHGKANKYFTLASYSSGTFFSNKYKSKCNFDLLLVIVDFCWSQGFLIFSNLPFLVHKFPFSCKSTSICLKISTVLGIFELQKAPMIYVVYFYTC